MDRDSRASRRLAAACALPLAFATPAVAGPTFGAGLTLTFGGGQTDVGVGVRVFSNDRRDSVVAMAGVDYLFREQSFRGSLGAAYLGNNFYTGADIGYNLGSGQLNFGLGAGYARTRGAPEVEPPVDDDCDPYCLQ